MMNDILKYVNIKNPLFRFFLFISFFAGVSIVDLLISTVNTAERMQYLLNFGITVVTTLAVYFITRYGANLVTSNPFNFFISAWIVFLLIHPTNSPLYFVIAISAIALGKYLFSKNKLPIFNPAALALAITYVVSYFIALVDSQAETLLVSWWGADLFQNMTQNIPVVNVLVPVFFLLGFAYYANIFRKIPYVVAFFGIFIISTFLYSVMNIPLDRSISLVSAMLFNSVAFCALVMIPEPKTSPNFVNQQVMVGMIAGISLFVFNTFLGAWPVDAMVNSILVANIATLGAKMYQQRPKIPSSVSST